MNNLDFFKSCFAYELNGTVAAFKSLPADKLDYKPNEKNKSAREQVAHLLGHITLFANILNSNVFEEKDEFDFADGQTAAAIYEERAKDLMIALEKYGEEKWDNETVELQHNGTTVIAVPRFRMMWIFLFDTIHHRGQLSAYIRPMGGKNPAIYGSSADTV